MCIAGAADWTVTYDSCWSGKYLLFSLQCLIPMYAKLVTGCYNACILRRTNLCNCAWIGHGRRLDILWRHGSYHCHYFCRSCSSVSGNCCVCGLTCLQTHRLIEPPVSMKQSTLLFHLRTTSHFPSANPMATTTKNIAKKERRPTIQEQEHVVPLQSFSGGFL